jgi:hypothetical protein
MGNSFNAKLRKGDNNVSLLIHGECSLKELNNIKFTNKIWNINCSYKR